MLTKQQKAKEIHAGCIKKNQRGVVEIVNCVIQESAKHSKLHKSSVIIKAFKNSDYNTYQFFF